MCKGQEAREGVPLNLTLCVGKMGREGRVSPWSLRSRFGLDPVVDAQ